MFFVLSKVLFFVLIPAWWIVALVIWRWRTKKPVVKKRLTVLIIALLVFFSNDWIYKKVTLAWYTPTVQLTPGKTYEAAVVLGGMSGYDRYGAGHFGHNSDRFIQTANLYHRGIVKKIIISGGSGLLNYAKPEAIFLRQEFMYNGIPDSAIIGEYASRNTYENAVYTKKICDSMHISPPILLVTSAQHMRRSEQVFKNAGVGFIPYQCDFKVTSGRFSVKDLVPDFGLFGKWPDLIKEMVGLVVYRLTGKA